MVERCPPTTRRATRPETGAWAPRRASATVVGLRLRGALPPTEDRMLSLLPCPDPACDAPAEITGTVTLESTAGPVAHVKTQCLWRHIFMMPLPAGSRATQK